MAEIPPPPDNLPEGFSLSNDREIQTLLEYYNRLVRLSEDIKTTNQQLLAHRDWLAKDLDRLEKHLASPYRTILLGFVGALLGMATYHLVLILVG